MTVMFVLFRLQPGLGFVEKMKSTKGGVEEEEDEEEEELLKKECSSHTGESDFCGFRIFVLCVYVF